MWYKHSRAQLTLTTQHTTFWAQFDSGETGVLFTSPHMAQAIQTISSMSLESVEVPAGIYRRTTSTEDGERRRHGLGVGRKWDERPLGVDRRQG